jgi:dolichyldiphosphatase
VKPRQQTAYGFSSTLRAREHACRRCEHPYPLTSAKIRAHSELFELAPVSMPAAEAETFKIFTVTYVEYLSSSRFSLAISLLALLPVFVYASLVTLAVTLRSPRPLSALLGLLLSHAANGVVKRSLAAPRPPPSVGSLHPLDTHGFPSDHAQQAGFCAGYAAALLRRAWREGKVKRWEAAVGAGALVSYCGSVCASRVLTRHHYVGQVVAGVAAGFVCGWMWAGGECFVLRTRLVRWVGTRWVLKEVGVRCAEWEATVGEEKLKSV